MSELGRVDQGDEAHRAKTIELIGQIHAAEPRCVLVVTGGGVAALSWLLGVPGASRTILEGMVPYAGPALADFLGYEPAQSVSTDTARAMARAALARAHRLDPDPAGALLGVAVTAALVSDRPKRGEHRAHVAVADDRGGRDWTLVLDKGRRSRMAEDALVSALVVAALAESCHIDAGVPPGLGPGDFLTSSPPRS